MKGKNQSTSSRIGPLEFFTVLVCVVLFFVSCGAPSSERAGMMEEPERGHFMYAGPKVMELQKLEEIKVWITTDSIRDMPHFLDGLNLNDSVIVEKIRVGKVMDVSLREENPAANNFTITSLNSKEQLVDGHDPTTWQWSVLPLKVGKHKLVVVAKIKMMMEEMDMIVYKDLPVFERMVEVSVIEDVTMSETPSNETDATQLIVGLLAVLLIGGFVWMFWKRKRGEQMTTLVNSADYENFLVKLEALIEMGEVEQALEVCEQFFKKYDFRDLVKRVIHLKSNFSSNESMFNRNLIDQDDFKRNKSKIVNELLEMKEEVELEKAK